MANLVDVRLRLVSFRAVPALPDLTQGQQAVRRTSQLAGGADAGSVELGLLWCEALWDSALAFCPAWLWLNFGDGFWNTHDCDC